MGIEVWRVRRSVPPGIDTVRDDSSADAASAVQRPAVEAESQPAPRPEVSKPVSAVEVPRFRMALLHYGEVGLCLSLQAGVELPRRFCDDIARCLGGQPDTAKYQQLDWPMLSSGGIDQSIDAARQVVTQKFGVLPEKVLVLGADLAAYYGPLTEAEPGVPMNHGRQSILLMSSLEEVMNSATAKRRLLHTLHEWRS